jgi:alcohol dehydrogenase
MQSTQAATPTTRNRRLWRISSAGSLSRLKLVTESLGPPARGEVQVRIAAVGLNFADIFACLGLYSATPEGSFVPGLESAGTIIAVGADTPGWQIGDRVMVLTRFGGYTDTINVPAATVWPIPPAWSFAEAAAYPVQALTAWYGIQQLGNARKDSIVLVQSAAGGVGLHALEALRTLEAKPVAVVGNERKRQWLIERQGLMPQAVVIRDRHYPAQLDAALRHYGASGFDVIFDAVYGDAFKPAFDRLAPEGRYVLFGAADFMSRGARPNPFRLLAGWLRRPRLDPLAMIPLNRGLLAFNLIWLWEQASRLPESMRATLALIPSPPHIGARFGFEQALEAMKLLQSGQTTGKVVLELPVE